MSIIVKQVMYTIDLLHCCTCAQVPLLAAIPYEENTTTQTPAIFLAREILKLM